MPSKQRHQIRDEQDPEPYPLGVLKKEMNVTAPLFESQENWPLDTTSSPKSQRSPLVISPEFIIGLYRLESNDRRQVLAEVKTLRYSRHHYRGTP